MKAFRGGLRHGRTLAWVLVAAIAALMLAGVTRADPDTTPPSLDSFSITPGSVNTYPAGGGVTWDASVSDDDSGVASVVMKMTPSTSGQETVPLHDNGGGDYSAHSIIYPSNEGTWTIDAIDVEDVAGNHLTYTSDDLANLSFPTSFDVVNTPSQPVVTSFAPDNGVVGDAIDITGSNFTQASEVDFNGTAAAIFAVNGDTSITANVPDGATTGKITVVNPAGPGVSTDDFTVNGGGGGSAPAVSSFAPTSGAVGDTIDITGTTFSGATAVDFNGTPSTNFTVNSDTDISADVPTGATTGKITVVGPGGQSDSTDDFTVNSGGGGGTPSIDTQGASTIDAAPGDTANLGYAVNGNGTLTGTQSICAYGDTSQGALADGLSSSGDTYDTSTYPNPGAVGVLLDPSLADGDYTVYLGLCDGSLYSGAYTIHVEAAATPSYTPTLDTYDYTVAAGGSFTPHITIAGDPGFSGTVHPFIATSADDNTPPDGFLPEPWGDISVPSAQQDETLPIDVDSGVAPGEYSFVIGTSVFGMPEQSLAVTVHVTQAAGQASGGIDADNAAGFDGSTDHVDGTAVQTGGTSFRAYMYNSGSSSIADPTITAESSSLTFDPPLSFPVSQTQGSLDPSNTLALDDLGNAGVSGTQFETGLTIDRTFQTVACSDTAACLGDPTSVDNSGGCQTIGVPSASAGDSIPTGNSLEIVTLDLTPTAGTRSYSVNLAFAADELDAAGISASLIGCDLSGMSGLAFSGGDAASATLGGVTGSPSEAIFVFQLVNNGAGPAQVKPMVEATSGAADAAPATSSGTSATIHSNTLDGDVEFASTAPVDWSLQNNTDWDAYLDGLVVTTTPTALDGTGSFQVTPGQVAVGSTNNTLTFTYGADDPGISDGTITLLVPDGWDAPTTDSGNGCVTVDDPDATVQTLGQLITVSNLTLGGGEVVNVTYGDTSCGDGATAPDTAGAQEWHAQEASTAGGTLTDLSSQPSVTVAAPDGAGTMDASPTLFHAGDSGSIAFTYTADTGGLQNGTVAIVVPPDWTPPSTDSSDPGYVRLTDGSGDVSIGDDGATIFVSGLSMDAGDTFTLTYGNGASGQGSGPEQFETLEQSSDTGSLSDIASSPTVTVVAADGSGTVDAQDQNGNDPPLLSSSSTGNTLTFTYAPADGGLIDGTVNLTVPAGWSAPDATDPAADGAVTADNGDLTVSGRTITVSGLTMGSGDQLTIVYGDTSGGGNGATAPASIGTTEWTMQEASTSDGTLKNLTAGSPQITIAAGNGLGTMTAAPSAFHVGDTNKSIVFTYTADPVGMSDGTVELVVPSDWAPPTTDAGAGHVSASKGTVAIGDDGQTIMVTGLTLTSSQTFTITYAGVDPTPGVEQWETLQQSYDPDGTALDAEDIGTSPTISVVAPDGSGTVDAQDQNSNDPPYVPSGSTGNTLTFAYTADDGGLSNGTVTLAVPAGWSAPDTDPSADGAVTIDNPDAGLAINGRTITVTGLNMAGGDVLTITYGDTSGGGNGATAPVATGSVAWTMQESSTGGTLVNLANGSPTVVVAAADGSGTMTASPTAFHVGDTNKSIVFTYTAADGGLSNGTVAVIVPFDWTPPTTDPGPGHVATSKGVASIGDDGQTVYVTGLTMDAGKTFTLTYSGASPSGTGAEDWETLEQFSDSDGTHATILDLAAFPSITVVAADGSGTMDVADEQSNDPPLIQKGTGGHTLTFTYTADDGGLANGTVVFTVPTGWPAPLTGGDDSPNALKGAYTTYDLPDGATFIAKKQVITIAGLNMEGGDTFTFTYGDTVDGGPGVKAPATTGNPDWTTTEQSLPAPLGKATKLAHQPKVPVIGKPKVTGVAPTAVAIGATTAITINGTNLAGVDNPSTGGIEFSNPDLGTSDVDLTTAVVNAAGTAVTFALPGDISAGKWAVQVTNAAGLGGDLSDGGTSAVSTAKLTVVDTAEVDDVTPSEAKVGKSITLTGSSLKGTTAVWFTGGAGGAGVSAKPTSVSASTVVVKVPPGAITGSVWTKSNGALSNEADFTVDYVTPAITSVTPGKVAVTATLTITGSHFTGVQDADNGGDVSIGGESIDPSLINWISDTKITVPVPSDLDTGPAEVDVTNATGTGVKNITIVAPTITAVTPSSAKAGKVVTITGTSLKGATLVTFAGGKTAQPTVATDGNSMKVTVPKGAQTGSFQISVAGVKVDSGAVVLTIL